MKSSYIPYCLISIALIVASCSNTKYLPEGELLYVGGKVRVEDSIIKKSQRKALQNDLKTLLRPKPNSSILGLRPKLLIYNLAGEPKKEKGIRYWLRNKVGEAPVLFSDVDLEYNSDVLQSNVENRGYFKARTSSDSTRHGKKATAEYTVSPRMQYKIREINFPQDSTALAAAIRKTKRGSILKNDQPYNLENIKAERERINDRLKQRGFYYFNPDYIIAKVDSTVGKYQVDINLAIKEETPANATNIYKINDVIVYPNYTLLNDTVKDRESDIIVHNDFTIIDSAKTFDPRIFDRTLYFKKGDIYNRRDHNLSLNRLVNMGTFKFVKNEFKLVDSEEHLLDTYYYLTLLPKKSIRAEVLGKTNSANYAGTELNVNWSNRNTFRGAELLTISASGGLEMQVSGQNKGYNVYRIGGEANLVWPRFISPFTIRSSSGFVPRTKATLGYEYQNRQKLYSLNSFKGSFGYQWKENIRKEHELHVMDINYVSPTNVSELYMRQTDSIPGLLKVIEKQLIFGPTYSYTYTNTMEKRKKHTFYYKGGLELAGNIAGLISGSNIKKGDTTTVFGVPFSQFVKVDSDVRHYMKLGNNSQLVSRVMVGAGYAYGNSSELPFIRQFFNGGTNSIRAFRARSIGPGIFDPNKDDSPFLPDQSGDLKLELNTEYRAKLFSVVHGAVFVDAGNIWLLNKDENKPGAEITKDFMKQLAVGTGVGLRFDLSFLILRTDLAFPLRKPYLPEGQRWVFDKISFGDGHWRKENLVFNLAIGYPF